MSIRIVLLLVSALLGITATPAIAGLSYVSAVRRVEAFIPLDNISESHSSSGFGTFNKSAHAYYANQYGDTMHADISQTSQLSHNGITETGTTSIGTGDAITDYRSLLRVTFDVSSTTHFDLRASFHYSRFEWDVLQGTKVLELDLRRTSEPDPVVLIHRQFIEFDLHGLGTDISKQGDLTPGRYQLTYDVMKKQVSEGNAGNYSLSFTAGRGTAVPLPPAAWTGLGMCSLIIARIHFRHVPRGSSSL